MYTANRSLGKFELCASELVGKILSTTTPNDQVGGEFCDWYGLFLGNKRAWIAQEDSFGFWYYREYLNHESAQKDWDVIVKEAT